MRVLFLTHWFPTDENPQKGVFILEQAKALRSVGVEVVIVHVHIESGKGMLRNRVSQLEMDGISVKRIDLSGWLWKFTYTVYPFQLRLIRKGVKRAGIELKTFDLLHSHVIHPAGAIGAKLAAEIGLPHFISEHWSNLAYYFDKNWFRNWGGGCVVEINRKH